MYIVKRLGLLALFSLAGAIIMYCYGWASLRGMFIKWTPLVKPPGNAIKVIALDYIQTASGDIYQYVYKQDCNDGCWVKSVNPSSDSDYFLPLDACGNLPDLENFIDSKAVCRYYGLGVSLTIEAIDRNGLVYSWDQTIGGEWDSVIPWVSSVIGAAAGLIIGLFVLLVVSYFDLLKRLQKRAQQKGVSG